jgi:death-on-curing family protein
MADNIITLNLWAMEISHGVLCQIFANHPEPVPPWHEGDTGKLETACACTETAAFGVEKYPDIESKAAKLFYSTIKLHPFPNGNKRFALIVTLGFLTLNQRRLTSEEGEVAKIAEWVAEGDPHTPEHDPEGIIAALTYYFREYTVEYDWEEHRRRQESAEGKQGGSVE